MKFDDGMSPTFKLIYKHLDQQYLEVKKDFLK